MGAAHVSISSLGADGVRAADANGDGIPYLVTSWEQGGLTRVYLTDRSTPGNTAWKSITVGKSPDGEDAVFFDADGDGDLDIVSSAEGSSRRIQIHWAPPAGSYTRESEWRTETLHADGIPMDVRRTHGCRSATRPRPHRRRKERAGFDRLARGARRLGVVWYREPAR